ncbi:amidohydrolase family protein [Bacillus sp. FSL W8-0116]|uniref:amidohydrolase family protein n=1 Tax=Bacillus sp. FSL W8-0116 TaxID=2978206 RepID=UPI0030FC5462
MPVAVHAIGDLAVERVLDVVEQYPSAKGKRDRIIHANILRHDLIARLKQQNHLILDIQPGFIRSDVSYTGRLPECLQQYVSPWKTILTEGIHCAGGSDAPIEDVNPFKHIGAVVERADGRTDENLTVYEAISLYTKGSAFACHHEHDRGKIQRGYKADFTIVDRDVFHISQEEISKTKAVMTVIDDEIVYTAY